MFGIARLTRLNADVTCGQNRQHVMILLTYRHLHRYRKNNVQYYYIAYSFTFISPTPSTHAPYSGGISLIGPDKTPFHFSVPIPSFYLLLLKLLFGAVLSFAQLGMSV